MNGESKAKRIVAFRKALQKSLDETAAELRQHMLYKYQQRLPSDPIYGESVIGTLKRSMKPTWLVDFFAAIEDDDGE